MRVDGEVAQEQGIRIDPSTQIVHVDGRRLQLDETKLTVVLNKPRHVVSAMSDPEGRRDLTEFTEPYSAPSTTGVSTTRPRGCCC